MLNYHYRLLKYATPLLKQAQNANAFVMLSQSSMRLTKALAGDLPTDDYKLVFDREKDGECHGMILSQTPSILKLIMKKIYNGIQGDCIDTSDDIWLRNLFETNKGFEVITVYERIDWPEYVNKQIFEAMCDYMKRLRKYVSEGYTLLQD